MELFDIHSLDSLLKFAEEEPGELVESTGTPEEPVEVDNRVFAIIKDGQIMGFSKGNQTIEAYLTLSHCIRPEALENFFIQEKESLFGNNKCLFDKDNTRIYDNGCVMSYLTPQARETDPTNENAMIINDYSQIPVSLYNISVVNSEGTKYLGKGTEQHQFYNTLKGKEYFQKKNVEKGERADQPFKKKTVPTEEIMEEVPNIKVTPVGSNTPSTSPTWKRDPNKVYKSDKKSMETIIDFIHTAASNSIKNGFSSLKDSSSTNEFLIYQVKRGSSNLPKHVIVNYVFKLKSATQQLSGYTTIPLTELKVVVLRDKQEFLVDGRDSAQSVGESSDSKSRTRRPNELKAPNANLKEYKVFTSDQLDFDDQLQKLENDSEVSPVEVTNEIVSDTPVESEELSPETVAAEKSDSVIDPEGESNIDALMEQTWNERQKRKNK